MAGFGKGRHHLKLPPEFAQQLLDLYEFRGPLNPRLLVTIAAAKNVGWTDQSVATVLGISRERVRQLRALAPHNLVSSIEVPPPPQPVPPEPKPPRPTLTVEQAAQLHQLNLNGRATGGMRADHPTVVASKEVTRLADSYIRAGYRLTEVAAAMGISKMALHFRLGQHGYRRLAPSQRHGSGPVSQSFEERT